MPRLHSVGPREASHLDVQRVRDELGISVFDAAHLVQSDTLLDRIEAAETVKELRACVLKLAQIVTRRE